MEKENLRLITVKELGEIIRLKKSSIYSLVHKRSIPFVKIGSKTLFKVIDIERYIEQNTHRSATEQIKMINTNRKIK
jgi:excisionase family DNA binding protein